MTPLSGSGKRKILHKNGEKMDQQIFQKLKSFERGSGERGTFKCALMGDLSGTRESIVRHRIRSMYAPISNDEKLF